MKIDENNYSNINSDHAPNIQNYHLNYQNNLNNNDIISERFYVNEVNNENHRPASNIQDNNQREILRDGLNINQDNEENHRPTSNIPDNDIKYILRYGSNINEVI